MTWLLFLCATTSAYVLPNALAFVMPWMALLTILGDITLLKASTLTSAQRQDFLFQQIKMSLHGGQNGRFPVPAIGKPDGHEVFTVCKHTYLGLFAVRQRKYESLCKQARSTNSLERHKACGREMTDALIGFFDQMVEMALPRATRFVRMELGMEVRDDDDELMELPSHWTQHNLYVRLCAELGYKAELKDDKGGYKYTPIDGFDEIQQLKPCCLATFQACWMKRYPKQFTRGVALSCFFLILAPPGREPFFLFPSVLLRFPFFGIVMMLMGCKLPFC